MWRGTPYEVRRRLDAVERRHGVRVVLASESGSRAWGFASGNSDYDIRFLYVRPTEWYLAVDLEDKRDVIATPIDGMRDMNGCDGIYAITLLRPR